MTCDRKVKCESVDSNTPCRACVSTRRECYHLPRDRPGRRRRDPVSTKEEVVRSKTSARTGSNKTQGYQSLDSECDMAVLDEQSSPTRPLLGTSSQSEPMLRHFSDDALSQVDVSSLFYRYHHLNSNKEKARSDGEDTPIQPSISCTWISEPERGHATTNFENPVWRPWTSDGMGMDRNATVISSTTRIRAVAGLRNVTEVLCRCTALRETLQSHAAASVGWSHGPKCVEADL